MFDESVSGITEEKYNLSNSQMNIWNLEQTYAGTSINVISETIRIQGTFDVALLQKCLNLILEADGSLRARITLVDQVPMQYETPYRKQMFPVYDFSTTDEEGIHRWEEAVSREAIPVLDQPLCQFFIIKLGVHEGGLLIRAHHIISDGWSQVLLINRIADTYLALLDGQEVKLEKSPSYRLHVESEKEYQESKAYNRDMEFWTQNMAIDASAVSLKAYPSADVSPIGRSLRFELSQMLSQKIYAFCSQNRVTPFSVYYIALAIYLKRIGGAEKFRIGVPIHNRINAVERETSGMFVSALPFVGEVDDNWSFSDFMGYLRDQWFGILRHQRYPLSQILELAANNDTRFQSEPLYHIALSFQNSKIYCNKDASILFSGQWNYNGYQAEHLCIQLSNMEGERRNIVNYVYLAQLFSEKEISDFHHYLTTILSQALDTPNKPIWQLPVLGDDELEKVIFSFNQTGQTQQNITIGERLQEIVKRHAKRVAVIQNGVRTTYEDLFAKANDVAHSLNGHISTEDELIAVLLDRSADLFSAMVGIIQAGHAWANLSTQWPEKRIEEVLVDGGVKAVITTAGMAKTLDLGDDIAVIDIASLPSTEKQPFAKRKLNDLAYVVYTSGSTGKPKGVEIEQRSLVNFCQNIETLFGHDAILSVCNVSFDAFIIDSICAMYHGRTVVLPSESDIEDPVKLGALIRQYAVDFMSMTPSQLMAYCKNKSFCQSLRRIESVMCGGEHFPNELLSIMKKHSNARIHNQYGPSETTVGVSYSLLNEASQLSVGKPMPGCRMYVLDEHCQPLPVGVYGELYVGGLCVGRGYRNAPGLTAEVFVDNAFEYGEKMYRTGDIACWTESGEILLRGRKDDQVKLRGLRIEPQEVAARLSMHEDIERVFVRVHEEDGEQILVAYYTSNKDIAEYELLSFSATYLPVYMIPSVFQRLDSVPITANGKIDYSRLPKPVRQSKETVIEAKTPTQQRIITIFSRVLDRNDLDASSDYFKCGGNSLNALETLAALEEDFGVRLRTADLWVCRNAVRLEACILEQDAQGRKVQGIQKAPKSLGYPLTSIQQSIYVQSSMDPTKLAYNMPGALRFNDGVDRQRLETALAKLVEAHSILRTRFEMDGDGIHQVIEQNVPFVLETLQATDLQAATKQFVRPFDLSKAPLFRTGLWSENGVTDVLFIDMHHIIGDGLSTPILIKQLNALYHGDELHISRVEFKDYAYWSATNQQEIPLPLAAYWREALDGYEGPIELPLDMPRPGQFDFKGNKVLATLPQRQKEQIDAYCEQKGITPYMLFMAAFGLLLCKASSSDDVVVGTPVAGRTRSEFMQVVGSFIETLPLRLKPKADLSISQYLLQVKDSILGLLDHQQMPLESIIASTQGERELGRHALYNTMLVMRPVEEDVYVLDGQKAQVIELPTNTSKLDLSLEIFSKDGGFGFAFEYATSLFYRRTIEFYSRSFLAIIQAILKDDAATIVQVDGIDIQDQLRLFERPHHMRTPFVDLPLDKQIEHLVQLMPDSPAMVFHGETTTYADLWQRAQHISGRLALHGIKQGDVVGFALLRGVDLIAAMIGIMRLGCSYMPMLASFPHDRLCYMVQTAKVSLVLCDETTRSELPNDWENILVTVEGNTKEVMLPKGRNGDDIMHVLFTSGSTGKPKGVLLHNRAISNLHAALTPLFDSAPGNILCTTNAVFDTFITESLLPLCHGRCVVMADEEEMMLPWRMAELVEREDVRIMALTPSRLQMCLGNDAYAEAVCRLSMMILAGEALSVSLKDRLRSLGDLRIMNLYGPTEAAVYATMADVTNVREMVIGKPLANCRAYVLDEQQQPVMPTALGELYLSGECVAKGYIGREELTREVFLPDVLFGEQRMYKTGDIVRLLPDGNLVFIGRRDAQVKLNGQRVELDEITNTIMAAKLVNEAVTIAYRMDETQPMKLRLYVVLGESDTSEKSIRDYLISQLPAYMVPSEIKMVPSLPRTASGKTDILALQQEAIEQNTRFEDVQAVGREKPVDAEPKEQDSSPVPDMDQTDRMPNTGQEDTTEQSDVPDVRFESVLTEQANTRTENVIQYDKLRKKTSNDASDGISVLIEETINSKPEAVKKSVSQADLIPLWKRVLASESIKTDASFFEQGGTSLGALHLLSLYFNQGYSLTLAQFYDNPTIDKQIQLLHEIVVQDKKPEPLSVGNTNGETEEKPLRLIQTSERDTVLLTGGTGFLGAHILKELLMTNKWNVVCVVRKGNAARLWEMLTWYFGPVWFRKHHRRITAIAGDVTQPNLGINCDLHAKTLDLIGCIVHAAADVRHHAQDDGHYKTNREGTRHALELAKAYHVPLYHISTISVSGEYIEKEPDKEVSYNETDRDIGQNWRDNIYVKTKVMAEKLVFDAIDSGLPAKVFRVGRLVGRLSDGVFQRKAQNNAFYCFVQALQYLDMIPASYAQIPIEVTAVDECARAIVTLMDGEQDVYHVFNPYTITLRALAQELGHPLEEVDDATFERHLMQKLEGVDFEKLSPLVDIYNRALKHRITVNPACEKTMEELSRYHFTWQKQDVGTELAAFFKPAKAGRKEGD